MSKKKYYRLLKSTLKEINEGDNYSNISKKFPDLKNPEHMLKQIQLVKQKNIKKELFNMFKNIANSFEGDDEVWKKILSKLNDKNSINTKKHNPKSFF